MGGKLNPRPGHAPGQGGLGFLTDGTWYLSAGADAFVLAHRACGGEKGAGNGTTHPSGSARNVAAASDDHMEAINTLALSPKGSMFITGDDEGRVRIFQLPVLGGGRDASSIEWESEQSGVEPLPVMVRFGAAVRSVAFSPTGNSFAAAGDEPGVIKLINKTDTRNHVVLRSSVREKSGSNDLDSVRQLAFDPLGDYLLSVGEHGKLCVWSITDQELSCTVDLLGSMAYCVSWAPDGTLIAVGTADGIKLCDRKSWRVVDTVGTDGGHTLGTIVSSCAFSVSGLYLLSGDAAGSVVMVDAQKRIVIDRWKGDHAVQQVCWNPCANSFAVLDAEGYINSVHDVLSEHMPASYATPETARTTTMPKIVTTELTPAAVISGSTRQVDEEEEEGVKILSRKRLRRASSNGAFADANQSTSGPEMDAEWENNHFDSNSIVADGSVSDMRRDNNDIDEDENDPAWKHGRYNQRSSRRRGENGGRNRFGGGLERCPGFMPSETPSAGGNKRYLCWNRLGTIMSFEEPTHHSVEIEFADGGRRPVRFTDHFGYNRGCMNDGGALLSCDSSAEHASLIFYRPFVSWTANADWTVRLKEGEAAVTLALGEDFAAVGTSNHALRIFSLSGVATAISLAPGSIVTATASKKRLCVVSCVPPSFALVVDLYDVDVGRSLLLPVYHGPLRLSPGAGLRWIGFSTGAQHDFPSQLVIFDSAQNFLTLEERVVDISAIAQSSFQWTILAENAARMASSDHFWPVAVHGRSTLGVPLYGIERYPSVAPKPPLKSIDFESVLTESTMSQKMMFEKRRKLEETRSEIARRCRSLDAGREVAEDDTELADLLDDLAERKSDADKATLKVIEEACKSKHASRALELTAHLNEPWAFKLALRVAEHYKQTALMDRMRISLESRLTSVEQNQMATHATKPNTKRICALRDRSSINDQTKGSLNDGDEGQLTEVSPVKGDSESLADRWKQRAKLHRGKARS